MSVPASESPSLATDPSALTSASLTRSSSRTSTGHPHSLANILEHVVVAQYSFQDFSERVSGGRITNGDARVQVLKRYKEDGSARHKFVTVQVAVDSQTYWLRIERGVQPNTKLSTSEISLSRGESNDTVKLAKQEDVLIPSSPKSKEKSTFVFDGDDARKPTLKDIARLLPAIRRYSNYNIATLNCFFVAAVIEEALTATGAYDCTLTGTRSMWALKPLNNVARKAILINFGVMTSPA